MAEGNTIARRFHYPPYMEEPGKRNFKERKLIENPEILFQDERRNGSVCNLIFYTPMSNDWEDAIMEVFPGSEKLFLEDKVKLELSDKKGHVSIYPSGKFVIQSNIENLTHFAGMFVQLDDLVTARRLERLALGNPDEDNNSDEE